MHAFGQGETSKAFEVNDEEKRNRDWLIASLARWLSSPIHMLSAICSQQICE